MKGTPPSRFDFLSYLTAKTHMTPYTDQCGRTIFPASIPSRIISLVPSQTELLADLGLEEKVIGISKFCIHPEKWFRTKTRVGGTKNIDMDCIQRLQPDLIIANKEENEQEQVEELAKNYPVWISDIRSIRDALDMMTAIGKITGTDSSATKLITSIEQRFETLSTSVQNRSHNPSTAYLIWRDPYMAAGGDTFIHAMMETCGFENIFKTTPRYPVTTTEQLRDLHCELLLLSSEPFPFKQKHIALIQEQLPGTKIVCVDGEIFSWYGSRMLYAPGYFEGLLQQL